MAKKQTIIRKKVSPYPLKGLVNLPNIPNAFPIHVLKLTMEGFLAEVGNAFLRVGLSYKFSYIFPVSKDAVAGEAKVMKTYDRATPNGTVERMAEFRTAIQSDRDRKLIHNFLVAIHQIEKPDLPE